MLNVCDRNRSWILSLWTLKRQIKTEREPPVLTWRRSRAGWHSHRSKALAFSSNQFGGFSQTNMRIHGITPITIAGKPQFGELSWGAINDYLHDRVVFAHYARFDISVLRKTLDVLNIPYPSFEYVCTWQVARVTWKHHPTFGLAYVAKCLGIGRLGTTHYQTPIHVLPLRWQPQLDGKHTL